MGGDGTNEVFDSIVRDVISGSRSSSTKGMNGTEFNGGDAESIVGGSIGSSSLPKGELMLGSMAGRNRGQGFRGKGDKKLSGGNVSVTNVGKFGLSFISSEDGYVADGSEIGTDIFAARGPKTTAERSSSSGRNDVGDVGAVGSDISLETETKEGIRTTNRKAFVMFGDKRTELETKILRGGEVGVINGKSGAVLCAMEMLDVGREFVGSEIVHTFVETNVESNFDTVGS